MGHGDATYILHANGFCSFNSCSDGEVCIWANDSTGVALEWPCAVHDGFVTLEHCHYVPHKVPDPSVSYHNSWLAEFGLIFPL